MTYAIKTQVRMRIFPLNPQGQVQPANLLRSTRLKPQFVLPTLSLGPPTRNPQPSRELWLTHPLKVLDDQGLLW